MKSALEAKVESVNLANDYANGLFPRLAEAFAPFVGSMIEKVNGGLLAKVDARVKALKLPEGNPANRIHVYRYYSNYSLVYIVKSCVSDGRGHAYYHESSIYVGEMKNGVLVKLSDPSNFKVDYKAEDVEAARERYCVAKRIADEAHSALFPFGEYDR